MSFIEGITLVFHYNIERKPVKKIKKHFDRLSILTNPPNNSLELKKGSTMNVLDLAVLALGCAFTMIIFVARTDLEKSRVRVKVKTKK